MSVVTLTVVSAGSSVTTTGMGSSIQCSPRHQPPHRRSVRCVVLIVTTTPPLYLPTFCLLHLPPCCIVPGKHHECESYR